MSTRAGLLGNEAGRMEAWVYPLKILADFQLHFHVRGYVLPAESLARTVTVRPESATILYAADTFAVRETLFVPVGEPGAIISLEVETREPLEVEAGFRRDFQLEWPAALGGTFMGWDPSLHAFVMGEEQKKFVAIVGSPSATEFHQEYATNYSRARENSFRLRAVPEGRERQVIAFAASFEGRPEAEKIYQRLISRQAELRQEAAEYYRTYLDQTVQVQLPDRELQEAYDWSRVSVAQGLVSNPYLGAGLIAGYRTSGDDQRPGFAWFFGRDALWAALALNAAGDFEHTRTALDFLSKYQRADGKIPHEISQSASLVPWFQKYPYPYASADATPLFIIAANDYVVGSGDVNFAKEKWESLWKAYQFLRSTYDAQGWPQNLGIGHGWVEGGPLLPVKTEFYQSGLGVEALRSLANLARVVGKEDARKELEQVFARQQTLLNQTFWVPEKNIYAFALDKDGKQMATESVLATVPMWFGLLDEGKAESMLNRLADFGHSADWGARIISSQDPRYHPGGYHFGAVWPLFTGWAAVGEYRYHRALPAYSNLRANALLAFDGSLGHVTEVLSGDYYQALSTASPHQIWSAAMVISPLLRGLLGLEGEAAGPRLRFVPHVPADWSSFRVNHVRVGNATLDLAYSRTPDELTLDVRNSGAGACEVEFSPAVSLRAKVSRLEVDGRSVPFRIEPHSVDQHVTGRFSVAGGQHRVRMYVRNDFGISVPATLPPLGSTSRNLKITSETWNASRNRLVLEVSGLAGSTYEIQLWNAGQVSGVEGAELVTAEGAARKIRIRLAGPENSYTHGTITIVFAGDRGRDAHGLPQAASPGVPSP